MSTTAWMVTDPDGGSVGICPDKLVAMGLAGYDYAVNNGVDLSNDPEEERTVRKLVARFWDDAEEAGWKIDKGEFVAES